MHRLIWICCLLGWVLPRLAWAQSLDFGEGIVAYYPFNGNARDMTHQGHDGLVNGATLTTDRFGQKRSAYQFDGIKQSIRIPYDPQLDFTEQAAYSVSLWIQPRDLNSGCILLKHFDYGLKWNQLKGALTFYTGLQGGYPSSAYKRWKSDQWYHLVLVQEADRIKLYINGQQDVSLAQAHQTSGGEQDLYLGAHPYFWGAFAGKIDDVVIYRRALNKYEAQALYQIQAMPLEVQPREAGAAIDAQKVAGVWQGVLTQPANRNIPNYAFWLKLEVKGERVTGHTRIEIQESDAYGVASIEGEIVGDRINFREIRITSQKNFQGFEWCKKFGRLSFLPDQDALRGSWFADNCQKGGEVILNRSQAPFNYYDNRLSTSVALGDLLKQMRAGERIEQQQSIKLEAENIEFKTNSAQISPRSVTYLTENLLPLLQQNPKVKLMVSGHTDNVGDDAYNLNLSKQRAKSVVDLLIQNGIEARRLSFEGYGESRPVASNATPEGRSANRRVEFELNMP